MSLEKSYNAVNDEVMKTLGAHCPLLKTLSVSYCSAIGDQGVIYVSDGCNSLQEVSLAHCYDVGSDAICYMLRKCRHLSVMSLECKCSSVYLTGAAINCSCQGALILMTLS